MKISPLFKGAQFGDHYLCRDGHHALFLSFTGNPVSQVRTYHEGYGVVVVNLDGTVVEGDDNVGDIIKRCYSDTWIAVKEESKKDCKKRCGECGYFMRYKDWMEDTGDCANITMNKECDMDIPNGYIVQVQDCDEACALFRTTRTPRVRRLIKEKPTFYKQLRKDS